MRCEAKKKQNLQVWEKKTREMEKGASKRMVLKCKKGTKVRVRRQCNKAGARI